jgi:hypothetical protein
MKAFYIRTLANIAAKPGVTRRDTLTILRRLSRSICEYRTAIYATRRAYRRHAAIQREHLPFTKRSGEKMERLARKYQPDGLELARSILVANGRMIVLDPAGNAEALGFEALADLLNINQVDRERARREGWRTLSDLVAVHGLENSAEHRGEGDGSPLYQACNLALMEFIKTAPADALPDPVGTGEKFGPEPPPVLRIVRDWTGS